MTKRKGHDYSTLIIWAALIVTVVRYAAAYIASDLGIIGGAVSDIISYGMGVTGLGMGMLDVLGTAYIMDGWRAKIPAARQRWSARFWILTGFMAANILIGIAILTPFTVSRIRHTSITDVLGSWDMGWALAVNLAPYLIVGGVVTSHTGVVTVANGNASGNAGAKDNAAGAPSGTGAPAGSRGNYMAYRVAQAARNGKGLMPVEEIMATFGVPKRTAYNWRIKYQREAHGHQTPLPS